MMKNLKRALLVLLLIFVGSRITAPSSYTLSSGELSVTMTPAIPGGNLIMPLGPVGELSWKLHKAPINIKSEFIISEDTKTLPTAYELSSFRKKFFAEKLLWSVVFAFIFCLLIFQKDERKRRKFVGLTMAGFVSLLLVILLIGVTTFNSAALRYPHYRGPVKDAQRVLQIIRESQGDWEGAQRSIDQTVANIFALSGTIYGSKGVNDSDTVKFLLVSDFHNNPIGVLLAKGLAEKTGADAILDAGDFTDRGTRPEAELFARFSNFSVPHIITSGNHEDVAAIERAKEIKGVQFLDNALADTAEIGGIRILGDADPNANLIENNPRDDLANEQFPILCERLLARYIEVQPQIILVHNPILGECARKYAEENKLPLVFVWGHKHQQALETGETVIGVSPGTSGAGGIKEIGRRQYGFAFLEFDRTTKRFVSGWLCQNSSSNLKQTSCSSF